jgi:glycerol kinase
MNGTNGTTDGTTNGAARVNGFIGAVDQGTTSSRFLIFNPRGEVVAAHNIEFKQHYPHPG